MILFLFGLLVLASAVPLEMQPSVDSSHLPKWPNLYEVSTRPWLYTLSQKYGRSITKLSDIPDEELQNIKNMHIDVVWFMGIWQLGNYGLHHDQTNPNLLQSYRNVLPDFTLADVIGSPYAISDYVVNPELGDDSDLAQLRARLNALGMFLCVDFVPNHSSVDSPYAISNPDWFVRQPAGESFDGSRYIKVNNIPLAFGSDVYSGGWTDTLQWNYWNPDARAHLAAALTSIAARADMVRCDMAQNELNDVYNRAWGSILSKNGFSPPADEFWSSAISQARRTNPNFAVMAEAYVYHITPTPEDELLQQLGFSFTYDKNLLDDLHNGQSIPSYIQGRGIRYFEKSANFLSNHDEPRAIPTLGGVPQSLMGAVIVYTIPGLRFFWWGQFEGFTAKLDVHLRRETAESTNTYVLNFYKTLTQVVKHEVFQKGVWEYVTFGAGSSLLGWRWTDAKGNKRLVAINYSSNDGQYGQAVLPDCVSAKGDSIVIPELLQGEKYTRSASEIRSSGLKIVLKAWQAQIFDYTDYQ